MEDKKPSSSSFQPNSPFFPADVAESAHQSRDKRGLRERAEQPDTMSHADYKAAAEAIARIGFRSYVVTYSKEERKLLKAMRKKRRHRRR